MSEKRNGGGDDNVINLFPSRAEGERVKILPDKKYKEETLFKINELLAYFKAQIDEIFQNNLFSDTSKQALENLGSLIFHGANEKKRKILELDNMRALLERLKKDTEIALRENKPDRIFPFVYDHFTQLAIYLGEREEMPAGLSTETAYARLDADYIRNLLPPLKSKDKKQKRQPLDIFVQITDVLLDVLENHDFRNAKIIKKLFKTIKELRVGMELSSTYRTPPYVGLFLANLAGHIEQGSRFGSETKILSETTYRQMMVFSNTLNTNEKEKITNLEIARLIGKISSWMKKLTADKNTTPEKIEEIYDDLESHSDTVFILDKYHFGNNLQLLQESMLKILATFDMARDEVEKIKLTTEEINNLFKIMEKLQKDINLINSHESE